MSKTTKTAATKTKTTAATEKARRDAKAKGKSNGNGKVNMDEALKEMADSGRYSFVGLDKPTAKVSKGAPVKTVVTRDGHKLPKPVFVILKADAGKVEAEETAAESKTAGSKKTGTKKTASKGKAAAGDSKRLTDEEVLARWKAARAKDKTLTEYGFLNALREGGRSCGNARFMALVGKK